VRVVQQPLTVACSVDGRPAKNVSEKNGKNVKNVKNVTNFLKRLKNVDKNR